jgi:hypothetical protein
VPGPIARLLLITSEWPVLGAAAPPTHASAAKRQAEALEAMGMSVEIFAFRGHGLYDYAAAWTRLRPRLHLERYDVVHAQDVGDVLLTFPKRVPLVITVARPRFAVRMLVRRADAVVVPSEEIGRRLHTRAPVHVMPPELDDTARAARLVDVYRSLTRA